jgi:4-amino-4-deoxy-L-arabinose transferase-like glycosyltransferase
MPRVEFADMSKAPSLAPLDAPAIAALERRAAAWAVAVATILFLVLLAIAPAVNPTFDDAKYVAVGRNFLDGHGPVTDFGVLFLKHSPLWPMMVVIPERLFGINAVRVGQLLNGFSGAAAILLVAALGWRIRPLVGAIAAVLYASLPYVFDIARTAGIDLPSIALTLLFLVVAMVAVRRDSLWLALLAGLVAAASFLIKETILPFAAVPFIAGVMWGVEWRVIGRTAAATLAVAAIGTSWWFAMFAGYTDRVYRADFPGWTLAPITIGIVLVCVLGFAIGPFARWVDGHPGTVVGRFRRPARWPSRTTLGWLATAAWFVLLFVFFQRTPKLLGASLLNPDQVRYFIDHSNWTVRLVVAYGVGALFVFVDLLRDRTRVSRATVDMAVAAIAGATLVLLVIGVGETPRHYIAELGLLLVLGTAGWALAARRLRERDRITIALCGLLVVAAVAVGGWYLARHGMPSIGLTAIAAGAAAVVAAAGFAWLAATRRMAYAGVAMIGLSLAVGMGSLGVRTVRLSGELDRLETQATATAVDWINSHATPGRTVAVGPYLAMGISILVPEDRNIIQVRHFLAIADPTAPYGLRSATGPLLDPIAVDDAPSKANQFNVYSAAQLHDMIVDGQAEYYVYAVNREESSASILGSLTPENGFTEVENIPFVGKLHGIDLHIYRVALDAVKAPTALHISPDALERLVDRLERDPGSSRPAAGNLVARIAAPTDGSEDTLLARLRTLASS